MLILTRKIGESIDVGENIKILVAQVKGKQVRIGVEAPIEIQVMRSEILNKKKNEPKQHSNNHVLRELLKEAVKHFNDPCEECDCGLHESCSMLKGKILKEKILQVIA